MLRNEAQCGKKTSYFSQSTAQLVADKAKRKRGVVLRVYNCPYCYQYHLTKTAERRPR